MITLTREEWYAKGVSLYGENTDDWEFKCPHCGNVQSAKSVSEQFRNEVPSQRHGLLKKGDRISHYCECYSPTCNWVAYGLFSSGIVVVMDPSKPYDINLVENCGYVFPYAKEVDP